MSLNPDQLALRRAALRVGLQITVACAAMVVLVIIAASLYMVYRLHSGETLSPGSVHGSLLFVESSDVLKALLTGGILGIILAGLIGWYSAHRAIRPLGEALAAQRRFVQDASHELRTPLTILDTRLQLALRREPPGTETAATLLQLRRDTAALNDVVTELLTAATSGRSGPPAEPIDVGPVITGTVEDLQPVAVTRQISLTAAVDGHPHARVAANSLHRALIALIDNALRHTPDGGAITAAARIHRNRVIITVTDTGSGITGVDQARMFERFVRTQTGAPDGGPRRSFGIGLALVREIAAGAGGSVEVAATGPEGTTMKLTLPLARTP